MLTNLKRRTALLLTVAVLSAVTALAPTTVGAAASKVPNLGTTVPADPYTAPNNEAVTTACPMSSAAAAGFTDTTSTDVDCIKMFGITQGATATTFEPDASIPRWQMALFLHRMFVPTGLAAAGTTTVPAFTDTSGLSTEIQNAISAIASHGITVGTTATTFSPDDNVSRDQMALFLYRLGGEITPYDVTTDATGIFDNGEADIATQTVNFSDISLTSIEAWEAIAAIYNLGGTAETCTAATATTCQTTYRPFVNITRAEMATMIKSVLDASNARPAGCTMQNTVALAAGGGAEATSISCRNADFTAQLNTTVDEFWLVRDDTSATTVAASVPFVALSGLVNVGAGGVAGVSTVGTVDAGDAITNALGNVAGNGCAAVAAATCRHWIHTGDSGSLYVDGTTDGFLWEGALSATAVGSTYATTMTSAISAAALSATCDFGTSIANVAATDGECAYQGTTRTITTTLTGASTAAVVDGYTVKYIDKVVSYGGGTGNQTVSFNTVYVTPVAGVATFDVVCSADPLPLASNAADDGAVAAAEYYESHEVTVDLGTAAAGTGHPVLAADITGGNIVGNTDVSCDDVVRAYSDGQQTLAVNQNYATVSVAGTLATATATATDQYGDGIAGVLVTFDTETVANATLTAQAGAANAQRSTLTTNSSGIASYSGVVCDAASVGLSGSVAFHVDDAAGNPEMSDTALTAPSATVEGTTVYCVVAGTDTVTETTETRNVADVAANDEVIGIAFTVDVGGAAGDPSVGGTYNLAFADCNGAKAKTIDMTGDISAGDLKTELETLTCITTVTITPTSADLLYTGYQIAMLGNTGNWGAVTVTEVVPLVEEGGGAAMSVAVGVIEDGNYGITFDHIDHDPLANSFTAKRTVQQRTLAGLAVVTTDYSVWTYDDTDVFNLAATPGATMAQWEAGLLADAGVSATDLSIAYRTGALTTGVSSFTLG